jgi:hypothetical protein
MRSNSFPSLRLVGAVLVFSSLSTAHRQLVAQAPRATRQMQPADLKAWKSIRQSVLSNDGKWFAYVLAPNEGDATLIIRSTGADAKEMKYPIGEAGGAGGGRGGPPGADGGAGQSLAISADSRWVAFTIYPAASAGRAGGRGGAGRGGAGRGGSGTGGGQDQAAAPAQNKMGLINLATGEKKEFDKVRRFAFNGDKPTWVAMQSFPEQPAPAAGGNAAGGNAAAAAARTQGTDLVLYNLSTADAVNVGNVAEFGFDDSGDWLAYTVDARDQIGNGVQLRNMRTDVVRPIDSDRALYRHLAWADSAPALLVLRGRADSTARDTLFSVVAFTDVAASSPRKTVFDAAQRNDFPAGMKISPDRAPRFSGDLSTVFFGIRDGRKSGERTLAGRPISRASTRRRKRIRRSSCGTPKIRASSRSRSCRSSRIVRSAICPNIGWPTTSSSACRTTISARST